MVLLLQVHVLYKLHNSIMH